jgi:polyhydroxyalkanoate synthesis regulator phasin
MVISVRDVADAVKLLGEVVKNTREVVKAIHDGATYPKRNHPSAKADIEELLAQMQITIEGLAESTKVASSFRFVTSDLEHSTSSAERELVRFNDYIVAQRGEVTRLRGRIRTLKGNCSRVRALRDKLNAQAKKKTYSAMFKLLGIKSGALADRLASHVGSLYADDERMIDHIEKTLGFSTRALKDVDAALGPPSLASPYNVPRAAALLGMYALLFDEPQRALDDLANELQSAREAFPK